MSYHNDDQDKKVGTETGAPDERSLDALAMRVKDASRRESQAEVEYHVLRRLAAEAERRLSECQAARNAAERALRDACSEATRPGLMTNARVVESL